MKLCFLDQFSMQDGKIHTSISLTQQVLDDLVCHDVDGNSEWASLLLQPNVSLFSSLFWGGGVLSACLLFYTLYMPHQLALMASMYQAVILLYLSSPPNSIP